MNEFMNQLVALRSKVGHLPSAALDVARGTVRNMGGANARGQAMIDAENARNARMMAANGLTPERMAQLDREAPLPPTPGEYLGRGLRAAGNGLGDLYARILAARSR